MNKKTALAALILSAGLMLTACTAENNPLSSLFGNEQSTAGTTDNSEITSSTTSSEAMNGDPDAAGGNPDFAKYIEVTVAEDKYFYENREISYDDLIKVFDELDGNTAVIINDENATLNAYEALTKALEEREILYEAAN